MVARALLVAALLLAGCASTPPPDKPKQGGLRTSTGTSRRRHIVAAKATAAARASEDAPVMEEVPDPEAKRLFESRLAEPAAAFTHAAGRPKVTEIALADTARGAAPGMRPAEEIAGATLAEGQRAMMPVSLRPGECATFIAQGGLGVIELDLFLVPADRSGGTRILAQDTGTGPIGVIGGHGRCYQNQGSTALDAELHATVRRGAGVVLVRGYRK